MCASPPKPSLVRCFNKMPLPQRGKRKKNSATPASFLEEGCCQGPADVRKYSRSEALEPAIRDGDSALVKPKFTSFRSGGPQPFLSSGFDVSTEGKALFKGNSGNQRLAPFVVKRLGAQARAGSRRMSRRRPGGLPFRFSSGSGILKVRRVREPSPCGCPFSACALRPGKRSPPRWFAGVNDRF